MKKTAVVIFFILGWAALSAQIFRSGPAASRPDGGTYGQVYIFSDLQGMAIEGGSTLASDVYILGIGGAWAPPVAASFPLIFNATSTANASSVYRFATEAFYLFSTKAGWGNVASYVPKLFFASMPATPYEIELVMQYSSRWDVAENASNSAAGIVIGEMGTSSSTNGRWVGYGEYKGPGGAVGVESNAISYETCAGTTGADISASVFAGHSQDFYRRYYKVRDDGTNFSFWYSADGLTWLRHWQYSRTAYMSHPNCIGFFLHDTENVGTHTLMVWSWKVQ